MYRKIYQLQAYVRRVFQSVDDGQTEDLKKLLSCKRYGEVRDRCGRTVLHRAILKRREEITLYLLEEFPSLINSRDSVSSFVVLDDVVVCFSV
jgi:hypothetical protein